MTDQQHDQHDDDQLDDDHDEQLEDEQLEDDQDVEADDPDVEAYDPDVETYDQDWSADDAPGMGPFIAAGVFSVVAVLLLVLAWSAFGPDDDDARDASRDASTVGRVDGASTATAPADPNRGGLSRLGRCVRAQAALRETLGAAQPALDQWEVHVGAMNKLVLGEISLAQATDFWERTRLGAQRRVRAFDDSLGALRAEGVDCPGPAFLAPGARVLPGCAREVHAAVRALQAAQVSVSTWEEHIHHMDMLRLGQMTPEQATEMWLSSWQRGVRDLDAYDSARDAADREDGCSQAGSSR
jgi:hypothetical protein